jgi:hypothetical protein
MRRAYFLTTAAVITTTLMTLPAFASSCVTGTVASYETAGFSCNVGGVTFSDISVTTTVSGTGVVTLGDFTPFTNGAESGLALTYSANTGTFAGSQADVAWLYNVSGSLLDDAFMSFTGTTTGTGTQSLSETLSNGVTLSLNSAGSTTATFSPKGSLGVIKDQNDFAGSAGSAESSALENGFSLTTTPIPGTLPLLATGLVGLWGLRRKQSKRSQVDSALAT